MYKIINISISLLIFLSLTITCSPPDDEESMILPPVSGSIKNIREKTYYPNQAVQEIFQVFFIMVRD